eukprot:COSAG05_NODE_1479_length_4770_cov_4.525583_10_plen_62_part_00
MTAEAKRTKSCKHQPELEPSSVVPYAHGIAMQGVGVLLTTTGTDATEEEDEEEEKGEDEYD